MQLKGMKVVVTGGAGFIGSHLVAALAAPERKNRVVVLDNFSVGELANLGVSGLSPDALSKDSQEIGASLEIIRGDVRDPAALEKAFAGADVVFHLATDCVRLSLVEPVTNHEINATGTHNCLWAARKAGIRRFIYCSSSEVYGDIAESLRKSGERRLSEESPKAPTTVYGASKLVGEHYTLAYHRTYGVPGMVVRPFNAYGPRAHITGPYGELIPRFATLLKAGAQPVIFGSGEQTRDFTYVTDTAAALIRSAETDALLGDSINLAHGEEIPVAEIGRLLAELIGVPFRPKHVEGRPGEIKSLGCDTRKAERVLGGKPPIAIREGLGLYLQWLDRQGLDFERLARELTEQNWKDKR